MAQSRVFRHEAGTGWSELVDGRPAPALRGHVRRYTGYVERSSVPLRRREVPGTDVTVIVSFGPRITVLGQGEARSFVAGLHHAPATTEFDGDQHGVQVDLTPFAARRLLGGVPMDAIGFPVVELEDLLGADGRRLAERLAGLPGWEARFALLDDVLGRALADGRGSPTELEWAWGRLLASGGRVPVSALVQELGWSPRRLTRGFREHVGLPPKTFARVVRFRRAIARLQREGAASLAEVALECGYYDQAHFNRDFRAFAGGSPTDYVARLMRDGLGVAGD